MLCDLRNLQALSVVQGTPDKLHYFSFKVLLYLFVVLLIIIFVRLLKYWNIHFKLVKSRRNCVCWFVDPLLLTPTCWSLIYKSSALIQGPPWFSWHRASQNLEKDLMGASFCCVGNPFCYGIQFVIEVLFCCKGRFDCGGPLAGCISFSVHLFPHFHIVYFKQCKSVA